MPSNSNFIVFLISIAIFIIGFFIAYAIQQRRVSTAIKEQKTARKEQNESQLVTQEIKQTINDTKAKLSDECLRSKELLASLESEREINHSIRLQQATESEALIGSKHELEIQRESAQKVQITLESQLDDARNIIKQEQATKETLGEIVSNLKATLSKSESRLESQGKNLQETQKRLSHIEEELRQQRVSSQQRLDANQLDLSKARESLSSTQSDLNGAVTNLQESRSQQQSTQERLDTTQLELSNLRESLGSTQSELNGTLANLQEVRTQRKSAQERLDASQIELTETRELLSSAQSELKATIANLQETRTQRDKAQNSLQVLQDAHNSLKKEHGELKTRSEEKEAHFSHQLRWIEESKKQLKVEFENLANELLEQKGKAFSSLSERNLQELLKPFQIEIKGFREKVESLHTQETEQRASLRTELQHLQQLNRDITDQASQLTKALKGQKKVQGNWGELMLENVLDSSGLRPDVDYQREKNFNTEEGKRRPDALIYLPQGRHLVIDAKTSLTAYLEYVNTEDELTRQRALCSHAKAVGDRIEELADKHYYDLPGLNSPEVVVMFIPVESAYIEALRQDTTLFQRAIERNVLVATPTTLLTSLNIVSQLWRFENQSQHSAELARKAERFYNKLASFLESMQDVGKKLDGARISYDKALGQLVNGKGNLIKQATEFQELGVAVKKELPADIVERAKLEVGQSSITTNINQRDETI